MQCQKGLSFYKVLAVKQQSEILFIMIVVNNKSQQQKPNLTL